MGSPNILYFDIETTITIFAGFALGKQYVDYKQILKRPEVMCISWAWNDEKVKHAIFDLKKYDLRKKDDDADYSLLHKFSQEYSKADLIVGQNSERFDVPWLRSRIIRHNLPPLPEILHDDIFRMTQKRVRHISHKLDDVGDYLGEGHKADHGNGMEWWIRICAHGDKKLLKEMLVYCDDDVELLRRVYKRQLPYLKSKLNLAAWYEDTRCTSPICGSKDVIKDGYRRTTVGKFQRYRCNACGNYFTGGVNLIQGAKKDIPR